MVRHLIADKMLGGVEKKVYLIALLNSYKSMRLLMHRQFEAFIFWEFYLGEELFLNSKI